MPSTKKTRNTQPIPRQPKVGLVYFDNPEALAYARFVESFHKWFALERFRDFTAKALDWQMLEYWTYFVQSLVAEHTFESVEQKYQMQVVVENAFDGLSAAARSYRQSKNTFMYLTAEERDDVRVAMKLCDSLLKLTDDKILTKVNNHVRKILAG